MQNKLSPNKSASTMVVLGELLLHGRDIRGRRWRGVAPLVCRSGRRASGRWRGARAIGLAARRGA
eukprot:4111276-Prymnesium_polylepis.1